MLRRPPRAWLPDHDLHFLTLRERDDEAIAKDGESGRPLRRAEEPPRLPRHRITREPMACPSRLRDHGVQGPCVCSERHRLTRAQAGDVLPGRGVHAGIVRPGCDPLLAGDERNQRTGTPAGPPSVGALRQRSRGEARRRHRRGAYPSPVGSTLRTDVVVHDRGVLAAAHQRFQPGRAQQGAPASGVAGDRGLDQAGGSEKQHLDTIARRPDRKLVWEAGREQLGCRP